jgi:hypothetical protein
LAPFFARLDSKFEKSQNRTKKNVGGKNEKGVKKPRFHADFKSVEKVLKTFTKKKL